jgi:putative ABC transport system permease protein
VKLRTVAFSNLKRRKSRAAFLVAGLLVGIGTVVALLTLSQALTVQAQNNLETYGANILVAPRTDGLSLTYGGVTLGTASAGQRDIRQADLARIDTIANRRNVAIVAPELLGAVKVDGRDGLLMGVQPKSEFDLKKWWSVDGRPPRNGDEVVAGSAAARALRLANGDRVAIGGRTFTVTGVLRPTGSEDDNLLVTDLGAAQTILHKPGKVTMVRIAALCSNCPVEKIVAQVGGVLPGTRVTAMQQQVKDRMHAIEQFRVFSWIVAGVIIGIEALVVFVTMMGSVNARTREIGIFRALGFRRLHVTGLILIEAVVASLLAGVLGYLAGMGVSYALLPVLAGQGATAGVSVAWAPALAVGAVGLAVTIGAVASLYPALRASRMDPTVALRAL